MTLTAGHGFADDLLRPVAPFPGAPGGPAVEGPTPSELSAMAAAQVVRRVIGDSWLPSCVPLSLPLRLRALEAELAGRWPLHAALSHEGAAWLWQGGPAPEVVHAWVPKFHRHPAEVGLPLRLRQGIVPQRQVFSLGQLAVTSPLRTALDLLADERGDPATVRALAQAAGVWGLERPPWHGVDGMGAARRAAARRAWERCAQAFR